MHVKSPETIEMTVSLTSSDGLQVLASAAIQLASSLSNSNIMTSIFDYKQLWRSYVYARGGHRTSSLWKKKNCEGKTIWRLEGLDGSSVLPPPIFIFFLLPPPRASTFVAPPLINNKKGLHFCRVAGGSNWIKLDQKLVAKGTDRTSRLQITAKTKGIVWLDQVSLMPSDTYKVNHTFVVNIDTQNISTSQEKLYWNLILLKPRNLKVNMNRCSKWLYQWCIRLSESLTYQISLYSQGHGFRTELVSMLLDLKPRFLRFPGLLKLFLI